MAYTYTTNNTTISNGGAVSGAGGTVTISGTGVGGAGTGLGYTIGGGAGQIYTTNGTNGTSYNWANPTDTVMVIKQDPATLEVKGNLVINGVDLEERLKTIEKVLQIPERDVKLEKKHPKLKKLYDEYIAALGKYRTFEAIKGEEDGTT
jgi:hypothetical protein